MVDNLFDTIDERNGGKNMDRESQEETRANAEQISQSMEQDYRRYPHSFEEEDS